MGSGGGGFHPPSQVNGGYEPPLLENLVNFVARWPTLRVRLGLLMKTSWMSALLITVVLICRVSVFCKDAPPETPKKPVTDEYQGVKVEDDYQWLENDSDPAVKGWSDAQNQRT